MRKHAPVALLGGFLLFPACTARAPQPSAELCRALDYELADCELTAGGAACELGETRALRVWVAATDRAQVEFSDRPGAPPYTATSSPADGGFRYALQIPSGAGRLKITHTSDSGCAEAQLTFAAAPRIHPAVRDADQQRRRGERETALAQLTAELPGLSGRDRGRALGLIARIERAEGRAENAALRFREAIAVHRASGDVYLELRDRLVLTYVLIAHLQRFPEARAVLDDPLFAAAPDAEARAIAAQYRAALSMGTGDTRTALVLLEESERRAMRMKLIELWRDAKQVEASALLEAGRAEDAAEQFQEILRMTPEGEDPCGRGMALANLGWARIIQREQARAGEIWPPQGADGPIVSALQGALAMWRGACPEPVRVQNALINLALVAVQEARGKDARRYLEEMKSIPAPLSPELMLWRLEIEGRIALAAGRGGEALDLYRQLENLAATTASPSGAWRAAVGRGHALELARRFDAAADAYREAEAMLDRTSVLVPAGQGREHFLGGHAESAKSAIEVLVHLGRYSDAAALARRARVRPLAALQRAHVLESLGSAQRAEWESAISAYLSERDALDREAERDWRLPQNRLNAARSAKREREQQLERSLERAFALVDGTVHPAPRTGGALRAPRAGELFLVYHPLRNGYAGFAVTAREVTGRSLGVVDPAAAPEVLAAQLLAPFRAQIVAASAIAVMAAGELREVDLHVLPFDGEPLIARAPLVYALDFAETASSAAARARAHAEPHHAQEALIVADPTGNLAAAEMEAQHTARALRTRGWNVEILLRERATGAAVRAQLLRARRFHYAGHARFGGLDGWESALPLAHRGRLTVADILALPDVPDTIVLSGCETARSGRRAQGDSLGIAHAFLTSGASEVVATSRPIGDRAAAAFSVELHAAELRAPADRDHPFASFVREAQLNLKKSAPGMDWSAFRALVR